MKTFILSFTLCMISFLCVSQKAYDIDDKSYYLIKETNGSIVMLWNVIKGKDRYFIKNEDAIIELVNTKDEKGNRKYEYKSLLAGLTSDENVSVEKVKLKLMSLKTFIDNYNLLKDPEYKINPKGKLLTRLSTFGGITNSPFLKNSGNIINPIFGVEFEFSEAIALPRHSIYFQGKQVFGSDKFDYSSTQIIVGYRFRIVNKEAFNFYTSLDLAQYIFTKTSGIILNGQDQFVESDIKDNGFEVPFTFGIGADLKLSETSFLSITYNELFALLLENKGNFSASFAIGYKFKI
jgi:hypothetical protein